MGIQSFPYENSKYIYSILLYNIFICGVRSLKEISSYGIVLIRYAILRLFVYLIHYHTNIAFSTNVCYRLLSRYNCLQVMLDFFLLSL